MPDNRVMTDADRCLFQRLHEHARTLERIIAECGRGQPRDLGVIHKLFF
jgi:hypothetical protein